MRLAVGFFLVICTVNFSSAIKNEEVDLTESPAGCWIIGAVFVVVALIFTLALCSCMKPKDKSKYQMPIPISNSKVNIDLKIPEAHEKSATSNYQERTGKIDEKTFQTQADEIATGDLFDKELATNATVDQNVVTNAANDMQTAVGRTQKPGEDQAQSLSPKSQEDKPKSNKPVMSTYANPQFMTQPQMQPNQYYMTPAQQQQLYYNNYIYNTSFPLPTSYQR